MQEKGEHEEKYVSLIRNDEQLEVLLKWQVITDSYGRDSYEMILSVEGEAFSSTAYDMFESLIGIRRKLESRGWRIAVQGSRLDAYPSGMARDMGGGEQVYILRPGEVATAEDLVGTLDPAEKENLATIEDQKTYFEYWYNQQ